jgi:hypothetical protein
MKYNYEPVSFDIEDSHKFTWMPRAVTTISYLQKSRNVSALIDSGAAFCIADIGLAKLIGVKPDHKRGVIIKGATGKKHTTKVYPATIGIQIDGLDMVELPVYFGNTDTNTLILGQRDFFDRFDVKFEKSNFTFDITQKKRERAS